LLRRFFSQFLKPERFEVDFRSVSPQELRRRVIQDGCALLRNALPPASVLRYRDMIEGIYQGIAERIRQGEKLSDWDRGHITDEIVIASYGRENSLLRLLDAPKFTAFMDVLFGKGRHRPSLADTVSRSVDHDQRDTTSLPLAPIHLDGIYHSTWPYFAINFWIPFTRCGKGTELPGLIIYPCYFEDVRAAIGISSAKELEKRREEAPNRVISMEPINEALGKLYKEKCISPITPRFEVGDVMLINSWTPHGTFWEEGMKGHRRSLELRFCGDGWNPEF
jgi:hypothetical protein